MINKKTITWTVLAIIIILGAYFFISVEKIQQSGNSIKIIGTGGSVIENPNIIEIRSDGFFPEITTISVGEKITFVNKDSKKHEIILKDFKVSHELNQNEEYVLTFDGKGTFDYYDKLNENFAGIIVVR